MKVGYFHRDLGTPSRTREAMIASVRRRMPDVDIVQLESREPPLALAVLDAYASVEGEWLLLDTDVIVRRDVRHVFEDPAFDIAVADRAGTMKPDEIGTKFMLAMPYNKGAVFSRSQAFWLAATDRLRQMSAKRQAWMGDQQAMCDTIASGTFAVKVLSSAYNYPPFSSTEDVRGQAILHYKGPRKKWMLQPKEAA